MFHNIQTYTDYTCNIYTYTDVYVPILASRVYKFRKIKTLALQRQHPVFYLLGFKPRPRQIDQAIKHSTNPSLTESTAAQDCSTDSEARAVPDHSPNNFSKTPPTHILGTDPEPSVLGRSRVTETKAQGALQLEIHTKNHVSGTPRAGQHGISVITMDPGRFSPPNFVRIPAKTYKNT